MKQRDASLTPGHHFGIEDLRGLIGPHGHPCLSLYLPTPTGGTGDAPDRFAGLLRHARHLLAGSLGDTEVREFLGPLEGLGPEFWQEQQRGLALFHSRDHDACWSLETPVPELAVVSESFHVRPLLRFLQENRHYFLLSLAQNHVGFFRGDAEGLRGKRVPGLPRSLVDALGEEDRERTISSHSTGGHGNMPVFHGQGKVESSRDEDLARFLRAVDRALWPVLRDEKAPLILAATERYHPTFAAVTRYAHLSHEGVHGNFERASADELHARAWPIVARSLEARTAEIRDRYDKLVSRARALDDLRAIARFSVQGRVGQLLLESGAQAWGLLDRETGEVRLHDGQEDAHDEDVLDDLAEAVLLRGGEVLSLAREEMPTKAPVAGILRW